MHCEIGNKSPNKPITLWTINNSESWFYVNSVYNYCLLVFTKQKVSRKVTYFRKNHKILPQKKIIKWCDVARYNKRFPVVISIKKDTSMCQCLFYQFRKICISIIRLNLSKTYQICVKPGNMNNVISYGHAI